MDWYFPPPWVSLCSPLRYVSLFLALLTDVCYSVGRGHGTGSHGYSSCYFSYTVSWTILPTVWVTTCTLWQIKHVQFTEVLLIWWKSQSTWYRFSYFVHPIYIRLSHYHSRLWTLWDNILDFTALKHLKNGCVQIVTKSCLTVQLLATADPTGAAVKYL